MGMPTTPADTAERSEYAAVRAATLALSAPLAVEDHVVQTMADVSPPKWHLAHTTWFFETFVLAEFVPGYRAVHPLYGFLYNSYYEAVGARHPRLERGQLSRPTVAEVLDYRRQVDARMDELLAAAAAAAPGRTATPRHARAAARTAAPGAASARFQPVRSL